MPLTYCASLYSDPAVGAACDRAALAASRMTREEYNATQLPRTVMAYDLARAAAEDRGWPLCLNINCDDRPDNPGAAILKLIDDARERQGLPREYSQTYAPRYYATGGEILQ